MTVRTKVPHPSGHLVLPTAGPALAEMSCNGNEVSFNCLTSDQGTVRDVVLFILKCRVMGVWDVVLLARRNADNPLPSNNFHLCAQSDYI